MMTGQTLFSVFIMVILIVGVYLPTNNTESIQARAGLILPSESIDTNLHPVSQSFNPPETRSSSSVNSSLPICDPSVSICSTEAECANSIPPPLVGTLNRHWVLYDQNIPVDVLEGLVTTSHMAYDDFAVSHYSRDMNFFVLPDPSYSQMLAVPGSYAFHDPDEIGKIEVEWELNAFPQWALPVKNDYVKVFGPLVFDCGHGAPNADTGAPATWRTEIHPPRVVMALRGGVGQRFYQFKHVQEPTLKQLPLKVTQADI